MNSNKLKEILLGLFMAVAGAPGCSSGTKGPAPSVTEDTGSVGIQLTLAGGETLAAISWQVLSGMTVAQSGVVHVASSSTASFLVGTLTAGPYTIDLTGTSTDGLVTCTGSGAFTVTARRTVQLSVNLQCSAPPAGTGSVAVATTLSNCATWQSMTASPTEIDVGGTVTLSASATAPDPSAITYLWSALSGTFGSPTAATTTFTSTAPGPVVVTLLVGDGPVSSGFVCSSSLDSTAVTVTFDAAHDAGLVLAPLLYGYPHVCTPCVIPPMLALAPQSVFVIDSTNRLWSFDSMGSSIANVALPTSIGNINGGGIALAAGDLYITVGQFTNEVVSFDLTLAPHSLPTGAFPGLSVPRGIAFDTSNQQFYVGNGAAAVNAYGPSGSPVTASGGFPGDYGPSGVAYDPDDDAIWVANYVGAPQSGTPVHSVAEYTPTGAAAQTFNYATQFVPPGGHQEPYSITVCPKAATGGGSTVLVVGFIDDGSGQGTGAVQSYSTTGAALGPSFAGPISKPYALSCDSQGNVYIADVTGLYRGSTSGQNLGLPGPFAGLTPPIYGVLAGPTIPGTGAPDGGPAQDAGSDGGPGHMGVPLLYKVPLTGTGTPPTVGSNDPNAQVLTYSVLNYLNNVGWVGTSKLVNVQPVFWLPTPTDLGFTISPLDSTDVWAPFFKASGQTYPPDPGDGYIQVQFSLPVSSVSIDELVFYSGPTAGTAILPPVPEPFLAAFSVSANGTLLADSNPNSFSNWQTLSVSVAGDQITTAVFGAPPGNTNETPNVMFKNLSYAY